MPTEQRIEGVILAAGSSFRAGAFKPALPLGGKPMVERCIEGMHDICGRIIVVGGHEFERLQSLVQDIDGVECVQNVAYQKGMFTSVKTGLSHVRGGRCFVLPVDIPLVPRRVYEKLLSADAEIVVPSFQGRNGHPVCCSSTVIPRILREPDEASFRDVLRAIGFRAVPVDAEEILIDVDTPRDYERVQQMFPLP
jgi:molybdenum cofactor cytidylyltransferase